MRLERKGSQVQCDHRRLFSEQSCAKVPATLYKHTPLRHLPGDLFVQPQNNTILDVDPVAKNCCFKMSYVIHLIWA